MVLAATHGHSVTVHLDASLEDKQEEIIVEANFPAAVWDLVKVLAGRDLAMRLLSQQVFFQNPSKVWHMWCFVVSNVFTSQLFDRRS